MPVQCLLNCCIVSTLYKKNFNWNCLLQNFVQLTSKFHLIFSKRKTNLLNRNTYRSAITLTTSQMLGAFDTFQVQDNAHLTIHTSFSVSISPLKRLWQPSSRALSHGRLLVSICNAHSVLNLWLKKGEFRSGFWKNMAFDLIIQMFMEEWYAIVKSHELNSFQGASIVKIHRNFYIPLDVCSFGLWRRQSRSIRTLFCAKI